MRCKYSEMWNPDKFQLALLRHIDELRALLDEANANKDQLMLSETSKALDVTIALLDESCAARSR